MKKMRYKKEGTCISVELNKHKGYSIVIFYNRANEDTNEYEIKTKLSRADIEDWKFTDGITDIISSDNIVADAYKFIMDKYENGYYDQYIERYEEEIRLLCLGIATDEKGRK